MAVAIIDRGRTVLMAKGPARPRIVAAVPMDHGAHFFQHGVIETCGVPIAGNRCIVASHYSAAPEVITDDIDGAFLKQFGLLVIPIAALVPLIGPVLPRRLKRQMQAVSATVAATHEELDRLQERLSDSGRVRRGCGSAPKTGPR